MIKEMEALRVATLPMAHPSWKTVALRSHDLRVYIRSITKLLCATSQSEGGRGAKTSILRAGFPEFESEQGDRRTRSKRGQWRSVYDIRHTYRLAPEAEH